MTKVSDVGAPYVLERLTRAKKDARIRLGELIRPRREKLSPALAPDAPYIGMEHVEAHSTKLLYMGKSGAMKSAANRFYDGDVLYGRLRPYLNKVHRAHFDGLCSAEFIVLPKTDGIDPDFLKWRMNADDFVRFASRLNAGDRPRVDFDQISNFEVLLPSLDEQHRIVAEIEEHLSRLEAGVAALKRVQANLKRYRASVLSELCKSNCVHLPSGWARKALGDLATVVRGGSPRPAGDPRYFGGPIPWITVGPITASIGKYLTSVPEGVTEAGKDRSRYITAGTLLLTNSGATLGVPKITAIDGCINDGVAALLNVSEPLKSYLLHFLASQTDRLRGTNQGAAQPNLNTTIIKAISVPLPPKDQMASIVAEIERRLSVVDELETQVSTDLARAERLRQSCLSKAFQG